MGWIIQGSIPGRSLLLLQETPRPALRTIQLPIECAMEVPSSWAKQPVSENNHVPSSSTEGKNGHILHICLYAFAVWTETNVLYLYILEKQGFLPNTNNKTGLYSKL